MTAQERITEWAELAENAPSGPWELTFGPRELPRVWSPDGEDLEPVAVVHGFFHEKDGRATGALIAASRTSVPTMAAALTAVLAKLSEVDTWEKYSTRDIGDAFDADSVLGLVQEARDAIETALEATT